MLMGRRGGDRIDGWIGWLTTFVVASTRKATGSQSLVALIVVVVAVAVAVTVVLVASEIVRCLMMSCSNIRCLAGFRSSSSSSSSCSSTLLVCPLSPLSSLPLSASVYPLPLPLQFPVPLAHPTSCFTPAR